MKHKLLIILVLIVVLLPVLPRETVTAYENTFFTYTIAVDGSWIRTQDAYMSAGVFLKGYGLSSPEDLFIYGDIVFIADTKNSRIVQYNMATSQIASLGEEYLVSPTGVTVAHDKIYIADYGASRIVILDMEGRLVTTIERPDSALYGKMSPYKPRKVCVDINGNIYIVGEGSYQGILLFDSKGIFNGYFGTNPTPMSLVESLIDVFYTNEQKDNLLNRIPLSITNATAGGDGLIYSVTQLDSLNALKKHNMAGTNILQKKNSFVGETNFVDVSVGDTGQIFAVTDTGSIHEYDNSGNLMFAFGGRAMSSEKFGLFSVVSAIDIDDKGNVYVLDKERGLFQVLYPTQFAEDTQRGIKSLNTGNYEQGKELWQQNLMFNGMSQLAHNGYGNVLFHLGDYEKALYHFKLADNRVRYSEAFWEIRNLAMNRILAWAFGLATFLKILTTVIKHLHRRKGILNPIKSGYQGFKRKNKVFSDIVYMKYTIRHPIDTFYYLKNGQAGSIISAGILYIMAFVVFLCDMLLRGFIFNPLAHGGLIPITVALMFIVPVSLFVAGNYLVSTINEGEGSLKNVFILTAYSLSTYIVFTPLVIVLTYILTLNEGFIITLSSLVIASYTSVTLYLGLKETHNYSVRETLKNILLTILIIIIVIVVFAVLYMLWGQVAEFIRGLYEEVMYRVRTR